MDRGADVIAQGALSDGEWFGGRMLLRRWKNRAAVDLVIRSGRHETGARDESDDNPATVAVLGFAEANSRDVPEFLWVVPPGEGIRG